MCQREAPREPQCQSFGDPPEPVVRAWVFSCGREVVTGLERAAAEALPQETCMHTDPSRFWLTLSLATPITLIQPSRVGY